jgi:hypothetical protein
MFETGPWAHGEFQLRITPTEPAAPRAMKLLVRREGATPQDLEWAATIAWSVFSSSGVSPFEAALAFSRSTHWDDCCMYDLEEPTAAERRAASLWEQAQRVGLRACGDGSFDDRNSGWLELGVDT